MIMYFSATGNTKYCAEFIAGRLNDESIISLNDMMKKNITEINCEGQKRIGIFSPVYDGDLAYAVSEFIERLEFRNVPEDCYIYGLFTCGSMSGNASERLGTVLSAKGLKLSAAFVVVMPDNYVLMFPQKSNEKIQSSLKNADVTLQTVIKDIEDCKKVFMRRGMKIPSFVMYLIHKFFIPSQRKVKGFTVSNDCIGCGLCAEVCPMNIIELRNNRPVWIKDKCACCLSCLHRCPKRAVNRQKSAKNGRYINPNVKL